MNNITMKLSDEITEYLEKFGTDEWGEHVLSYEDCIEMILESYMRTHKEPPQIKYEVFMI